VLASAAVQLLVVVMMEAAGFEHYEMMHVPLSSDALRHWLT
jgi:hypothetical protein